MNWIGFSDYAIGLYVKAGGVALFTATGGGDSSCRSELPLAVFKFLANVDSTRLLIML